MTDILTDANGQVTIPADIRRRCGMMPRTPVRVVETKGGVLLVPLTDAPMPPELSAELGAWTHLGAISATEWVYDEEAP